jgi:hypothetical protein
MHSISLEKKCVPLTCALNAKFEIKKARVQFFFSWWVKSLIRLLTFNFTDLLKSVGIAKDQSSRGRNDSLYYALFYINQIDFL